MTQNVPFGRNFFAPLLARFSLTDTAHHTSVVKASSFTGLGKRSAIILSNVTFIPGWLWGAVILGCVLFSLAPSVYELSRSGDLHTERSFELIHNFPTDYNFYLSRIREGLEGHWTVTERYTSEPHAGSLIHEVYLLMGQVGRWVNVPYWRPADVYHTARIVLAVVLLAAMAAFVRSVYGGKGEMVVLLTFLLAVTASSWPKLVAVVDTSVVPATIQNIISWRFGGYMPWWSVMDSLQRITFIPHLLIGQAGIAVLILLVSNHAHLKRNGNIVMIGVFAFVLGMIFPPGLLFVYAYMGLWFLVHIRTWKRWIVPYGAIVIISMPSLVYLYLMTGMYPWKRLAEVDIIRPITFDFVEYFKAVGPVLPLGLIGLCVALVTGETTVLPAVVWVLSWALLLFVFSFVPAQSPLRFSEMIPHVPLAVLTMYLFLRFRLRAALFLSGMLLLVGFGQMYSSYKWQTDFVDHKIRATVPLVPTGSYVMYPLRDFVGAMQILSETTPRGSIVLSETTAGNYIPVYSGLSVYVGHDNTVALEQKKVFVADFFAGKLKSDAAHTWIRRNGIDYVFFGPQEREDGGVTDLRSVYPFLKEYYANAHVTLYSIE